MTERLIEAVKRGDEFLVCSLLEKGIDVNSQEGRYGRTALQMATFEKNQSMVSLLIERGAEVNQKDYVRIS